MSEAKSATEPVLLSGGNPQIAKGYGDAPVQAYIAAMPGWKRGVGERLDALIAHTVPGVKKAVKWNTPLYGVEEERWFLAYHCFTRYIKETFFRGLSLDPVPPVGSKSGDTRYFHIHEDDEFDEAQLADWIRQASASPGEKMRGHKMSDQQDSSALIDAKIAALGDWRGETLARLRALITAADPEVAEVVKWRKPSNPSGVPVWEHAGILCTGETYKDKVKLTFAKGASRDDPKRLFNASLDGGTRRAIDLGEGDEIDSEALQALVRGAVAANLADSAR